MFVGPPIFQIDKQVTLAGPTWCVGDMSFIRPFPRFTYKIKAIRSLLQKLFMDASDFFY